MSVRKNRITLISSSFSVGGAEKTAINLANYYASLGQEVTMIVLSSQGPFKNQLSPLVNLVTLNAKGCYAFLKLYKALKKDDSDVVFSVSRETSLIAGVLEHFLTLPLVCCESNITSLAQEKSLLKKVFNKFLLKLSYKKVNAIIANSENIKGELISSGLVLGDKISVIGNPVIVPEFSNLIEAGVSHPWFDKDQFDLVLNIGRLDEKKNQEFLLYSFSELYKQNKRARLILLGEGYLESRLNRLAKLLAIEAVIEILPFQENPLPFYKAASVFALTSCTEGVSNVLVEAMWCRTPVVALGYPISKESIVKLDELGGLLSTDDPSEFASNLKMAIDSQDAEGLDKAYQKSLKYKTSTIAGLYYEASTGTSIN